MKPAEKKSDQPKLQEKDRDTKKKRTASKKIPTRMGYHGSDEEKNLNPEE